MDESLPPANAATPGGVDRRGFLQGAARGIAGSSVFATLLWSQTKPATALPSQSLRPPGALAEADFLKACVRCGLCVRACPYHILSLAQPGAAEPLGTPFFRARSGPCEMCEDIPCVPACPTGALDRTLKKIDDARMGLAVLSDHETCLNFQGLRCDVCYRVCPAIDKAITLEMTPDLRSGHHAKFIPVVHSQYCTGCGKCEQGCVLPQAAIKVIPIALAKGASAAHYRLGWEEKALHGEAVPNLIKLPIRRPDGQP
ncbi:periplasmic nitrate reductase subunit NapG [Magnetococcus marinus MC-1]|uniref:Periplasmic nitrate reductase subunit NapG n=1 Tax=Magnetococcus marinus (strain ATCC BAA-1437 / JCM 17883 / MC-1) TaxID=156889 RepID=A0L806_MAGMM|nr:ferredoxin-type protein NapG [Magnetococcus marinus]ABK44099.1 periplasmic nitrate reductase subunit NapG [Magnetococcus marinus MC-1]